MKLIFWLLTLLSPVSGVIITMGFLILVDFITGAYASLRNGESIKRRKIGNTISKFFIYNLVILAAYFMEEYIMSEIPFVKIIAGFIAIAEIKSILENFSRIYGINPLRALTRFLKQTYLKEAADSPSEKKKTTE